MNCVDNKSTLLEELENYSLTIISHSRDESLDIRSTTAIMWHVGEAAFSIGTRSVYVDMHELIQIVTEGWKTSNSVQSGWN